MGSIRFQSGLAVVKVVFGKYLASRPVPLPPDWMVSGTVNWRAALMPTRLWSVLPHGLLAANTSEPSGVSGAQAKPRQSSLPALYGSRVGEGTKSANGLSTPLEIFDSPPLVALQDLSEV